MGRLRLAFALTFAACTSNPVAPGTDMAVEPDLSVRCKKDGDCLQPTPVCDVASGACVACLSDVNCPAGKICKQKDCVPGCAPMHGCPDGGGVCDPQSGLCKVCGGDGDCGGATPRCEAASGLCV